MASNFLNALNGKDVAKDGTVQEPRRGIVNFVEGSGVTLTLADNPSTGATDLTIASSSGGSGLVDYKDSVRLATTADHVLSGLTAIDGVVPLSNDRILVKSQTTVAQNGIYVAASGAWSRASDFDSDTDVTSGAAVRVAEGSTLTGTAWYVSTADPITVGATGITWTEVTGGSELSASAGQNINAAAAVAGSTGEASDAGHTHAVQVGTPVPIGDANAAGSSDNLARADHVHQALTSDTQPANVTKAASSIGASGLAARADHKHDITTAAAVALAAANAEGNATSLARSNHTHARPTIAETLVQGNAAGANTITYGTNPSGDTTAAARVANNKTIASARNAANDANIAVIKVNASNQTEIHDGELIVDPSKPYVVASNDETWQHHGVVSAHPSTGSGQYAEYILAGTAADGRYIRLPSDGATIQLEAF